MMRMLFRPSSSSTKATASTSEFSSGETEGGGTSHSEPPSACPGGVDVSANASSPSLEGGVADTSTSARDNTKISCDGMLCINQNFDGGDIDDDGVAYADPILQFGNDEHDDLDLGESRSCNPQTGTVDAYEIHDSQVDHSGIKQVDDIATKNTDQDPSQHTHGLQEGDHVIRWKILGFCYPIQIHGIVLSVGPDIVTIVDCGLTSTKGFDKAGYSDEDIEECDCPTPKKSQNHGKTRRRLNVLTLVDDKDIKKWSKVRYGEEVQLKVHSSEDENDSATPQQSTGVDEGSSETQDSGNQQESLPTDNLLEKYEQEESALSVEVESRSGGLEFENEYNDSESPQQTPKELIRSSSSRSSSFWCFSSPKNDRTGSVSDGTKFLKESPEKEKHKSASKEKEAKLQNQPTSRTPLRLPKSDPPILVLARLRFLLEYGEESFPSSGNENSNNSKQSEQPLLPPHHLLYANSECIAVWCKTGHWSTLQASVFLHSTTVGNVKQTATLAMFLSAQTVTVPASGLWGFFGGTTTVSLFSTQPWLVPALVGGGVVYVGLPMVVLWKAKGRWTDAEKRLNDGFWRTAEPEVIVELIRCWSDLEC